MCGIAGVVSMRGEPIVDLDRTVAVMNHLLEHRGPDGQGQWSNSA